MRCLVTGATGFIGKALCARLRDEGHSLVAVSHGGGPVVEGVVASALPLESGAGVQGLCDDTEMVFHAAGVAHQNAQATAYDAVNFQATMELAREAERAGVRCFVFLSSVKAMGEARTVMRRDVGDCSEPQEPYGLSKWRAEEALRQEFGGSSMGVVIVRSALVYGEGCKGNLAALAAAVRSGLPRPPDVGERSMIALADLVDLLLVVAQLSPGSPATLIATDGEIYSTARIHDALRVAQGKPPRRSWLPLSVWRLGAALADLLRGRMPGGTEERLFGTEVYDNASAVAITGWRPGLVLESVAGEMIDSAGGSPT